jgi:hypothetical protein
MHEVVTLREEAGSFRKDEAAAKECLASKFPDADKDGAAATPGWHGDLSLALGLYVMLLNSASA